jgi:hypothetical protein
MVERSESIGTLALNREDSSAEAKQEDKSGMNLSPTTRIRIDPCRDLSKLYSIFALTQIRRGGYGRHSGGGNFDNNRRNY